MNRISYLNVLRLLATLSVVFLHASAGIYDNMVSDYSNFEIALSIDKHILEWGVPVFVLISGALFLRRDKEITYPILIKKYVRRIALALLIFGLPMCVMETVFSHTGGVIQSLVNWVTGHCWAHMWYLYMLLGLYLITPIVKPFVEKASDKELQIALWLLFILSSLFPTLRSAGLDLEGYMIISTPYPFMYLLGYYLCWRMKSPWSKNRWLLVAVIALCGGIIVWRCIHFMKSYGYGDPVLICMASSLFLLIKSLNADSRIANVLTPYCFGIYLTHTVFINVAYKVMGLNLTSIVPVLALSPLFFLLSLLATYILMKIKPLKKYVL